MFAGRRRFAGRARRCASVAGPGEGSREERFRAYLAECTTTYGYDRDALARIGEYELAPDERAWRACAYEAAEAILVAGSLVPEAYRP